MAYRRGGKAASNEFSHSNPQSVEGPKGRRAAKKIHGKEAIWLGIGVAARLARGSTAIKRGFSQKGRRQEGVNCENVTRHTNEFPILR